MTESRQHAKLVHGLRTAARWSRAPATALAIAALSSFAGCQKSGDAKPRLLLFPSPPAKPRIQFLTSASRAADIEGPASDFVTFALGYEPVNRLVLEKPYGVAAYKGAVYVCDTKIPALCRLDFKNRSFSVLGVDGPERLRKPIHVTIDQLGYKFVADAQRRQIVVFDPDDRYVTAFDVPEPSHPVDVAVWENELYVLDNDDTCQIVVLDRQSGKVLRTFGSRGEEPGQFQTPNSLSVGPDGYLYVSDTMNWRVQKLTRLGEPIWAKGTAGFRLGQFGRPRGIRVGPDGIIYVADAATELIQMLSPDGEVLMHFGGPGSVPGSLVLPAIAAVDATSIPYFKEHIHKDFNAEYLLFVANQFGGHLVSVYAFGSFPEGFRYSEAEIASLPPVGNAEDKVPTAAPDGAGASDQASESTPRTDKD